LGQVNYDATSITVAHAGDPAESLKARPAELPDDADEQAFSEMVAMAAAKEYEARYGPLERGWGRGRPSGDVSHIDEVLDLWVEVTGAAERPPISDLSHEAWQRWWVWLHRQEAIAREWITEPSRWALVVRTAHAVLAHEITGDDPDAWRRTGRDYWLTGAALDDALAGKNPTPLDVVRAAFGPAAAAERAARLERLEARTQAAVARFNAERGLPPLEVPEDEGGAG
jgi:hypothetical protein